MWARHLLLVALLVAVVAGLRASLFPVTRPEVPVRFDPGPTDDAEFRAVVARVNESFRIDWAEKGLTPAPRADDLAIARRLSLALTGTTPSLEDIRQFEAAPDNHRVTGWTHHLLNDHRFGDYFADRLARAYVGTEDGPLIAYRKRRFLAWLSEALVKNESYAAIVREMIGSQGLNTDRPSVNFIAAQFDDNNKGPDAEKLAIRVTRSFLGLRIDCAQCHDHFLEPRWKQTDFQAMAAFFGQTRHVATHISDGDGEYSFENKATGERITIAPAVPFLPELLPAEGTRRQRLAAWVTHPQNQYFARATVNRVWAMMFLRPLLKRVEAQKLDEPIPPALQILADDFVAHNHDLHRLIQLIAATDVFRLDSAAAHELTDEHDKAWAAFPVTRLRPEQVIGNVLQAATVRTINQSSHVFVRLARLTNQRDFVQRYGDIDDNDDGATGTIPQRLIMLNGDLVNDKAKEELFNASSQIAKAAPDDRAAVEAAYLTVLTRRPTVKESDHFAARLHGSTGDDRVRHMTDLFWALFNSTELSWNH